MFRPVWVEVNLDNLIYNIKKVRELTNENAIVTAVIKADGYGHGATVIAKTLLENGADRLAVATITEALLLRKYYKDVEILVLGYTKSDAIHQAIENNIIQTVYYYEQLKLFSDIAVKMNKTLKVHIKIDTGMTRIGMLSNEDTVNKIAEMDKLPNIYIEGMYTHFAKADEKDKTETYKQVEKFNYVKNALEERGIKFDIYHVSNSAAIMDMSLDYDMVRAGIMIYGLYPSGEVNHDIELREVMSLHARITRIQEVEAGTGISYGHVYVTSEKRKIAALPIGYADGLSRSLTGNAHVIVAGKKVPIVGRICMDQCMIDVTGLDVDVDDEVILFGEKDGLRISIDDIANQLGTINYEVVCMINKRVIRVYTKNNEKIEEVDYLLLL